MVWYKPESEESQAAQLQHYIRENLIDFTEDGSFYRTLSDQSVLSMVRNGYSAGRIAWLLKRRPDLRIAEICHRGVEMHFRDLRRLAVARDRGGYGAISIISGRYQTSVILD